MVDIMRSIGIKSVFVEDAVFPCERASISCWTWKTYMIYPCNTGPSRNSRAWETSVNVDSKQRTGRLPTGLCMKYFTLITTHCSNNM